MALYGLFDVNKKAQRHHEGRLNMSWYQDCASQNAEKDLDANGFYTLRKSDGKWLQVAG